MMKDHNNENGTVTLEACIVVPMFITIMLALCGIFVLFMGQQIITHATIQSAKSLSFDPYATERNAAAGEKELAQMFGDIFSAGHSDYVSTRRWYSDESSYLKSVASARFKAFISENGSKNKDVLEIIGIKGGANGINFSNCKVEDGVLTMSVKYTQCFIFDIAGLGEFDREISVKVKLFTYSEIGGNTYEVFFDSRGGTVVTNRVTPDSNDALPKPSRPGYIFAGWSTSRYGAKVDIKTLEDAKAYGEKSNGRATLYAVWTKIEPEIFKREDRKITSVDDASLDFKLKTDVEELKSQGLKMKVTVTYTLDYTSDLGYAYDCVTVNGDSREHNHGKAQDTIFGDAVKTVTWSETYDTPSQVIKLEFYTSDSYWEWNAGMFYVKDLVVTVTFE